MLRRQIATAFIVLVISATAFALTKSITETSPSVANIPTPSKSAGVASKEPEIRSAEWLAGKNKNGYTIQIFADTDDFAIPAFTRQWAPRRPVAHYQISHEGEIWHFLTYGVFNSAEAARAALVELPKAIRLFSPRIQPLNQVIARLRGVAEIASGATSMSDIEQNTGDFAISLYSAETIRELRQFVRDHGIDDAYFARAKEGGNPWVTLLKGRYPTLEEARLDLEALPDSVREYAWVKKLGSPNLEISTLDQTFDTASRVKTAGDTIKKDRLWVASQPRDSLTVLLATGSDRKALHRVGTRLGLADDVHLITYSGQGGVRYAAVAGSYSDYTGAQKNLDSVKHRISSSPIIITFGVLKDASSGDKESVDFMGDHDLVRTRVAKSETDTD